MNESNDISFCPYKGLQPFTAQDTEYFFGREEEQDVVSSNLEVAHLTVLYGASGVGKTSLLLAGVLTRIEQKKEAVIIFFRDWQNAEFISALKKETVLAIQRTTGREIKVDESKQFSDFLKECAKAFSGPILFIFDQFEEYFMYHAAYSGSGRSSNNGYFDFDVELARTINRKDLAVNFLLSLREDGISKLDRLQTRIPNLLGNLLRLDHLNLKAAKDAINKPLEVYNRKRPGKAPVKAQPELVQKLLAQVQTGQFILNEGTQGVTTQAKLSGKIETPFLQLVLERLWEEEFKKWGLQKNSDVNWITVKTLNDLGGAENIVRTHLDNVMSGLGKLAQAKGKSITGEEASELAAMVFRFLVTPNESKIAHTAAALTAFAELSDAGSEKLQELLDLLSSPDVRILRRVDPPAGKTGARYEIFHDVLAPAILSWRKRFVDERKLREAERQTQTQRERAEKEARAAFRLRLLAGTLAIVTVIAVAFGIFAVRLRAQALAAKQAATEEHAKAEIQKQQNIELQKALDTSEAEAASAIRDANARIHLAFVKEAEAEEASAKLIMLRAALEKEKNEKATTRTINDKYQEAENSYYAGNVEEAIGKYKETIPLYDKTQNLKGKAAAFSTIGRRYGELAFKSPSEDGFTDDSEMQATSDDSKKYLFEARNNLDETRKIYANLEAHSSDHYNEAATLSFIAAMFVKASDDRDFDDESTVKEYRTIAVEYYEAALKLYRAAPNRRKEEVFTLEKLTEVLPELDIDKAIVYNGALRKIYHQANDSEKEAAALSKLAQLYSKANKSPEAITAYQEAIPLYRSTKNTGGEVLALMGIRAIYKNTNNRVDEIDTLQQLLSVDKTVRDPRSTSGRPRFLNSLLSRVDWYSRLAELYEANGDKPAALAQYVKAISLLRKAAAVSSPKPSPPTLQRYQLAEAQTVAKMAKLQQGMGNIQQAIDLYGQALDFFSTREMFKEEVEVLKALGDVYKAKGDEENAGAYFRKAKEIEFTKIKEENAVQPRP